MLDPKRSLARTLAAVRIPEKKRFPGPMAAKAHKGYEGTKKKMGCPCTIGRAQSWAREMRKRKK